MLGPTVAAVAATATSDATAAAGVPLVGAIAGRTQTRPVRLRLACIATTWELGGCMHTAMPCIAGAATDLDVATFPDS